LNRRMRSRMYSGAGGRRPCPCLPEYNEIGQARNSCPDILAEGKLHYVKKGAELRKGIGIRPRKASVYFSRV
jgi:hypothetical protein